ncbi:MAG TPA: hypothetical protein VN778_03120, partial [Verrucomicrobiae bacterium]|nr:hypothetical protein [Verrucomicrobiae bacterium]
MPSSVPPCLCYYKNMKLKRDGYRRNRGGTSRVYDVTCGHCGEHVAFYQKDGPGALLRMYVDRFVDRPLHGEQLICGGCQSVLGSRMVY